MKKGNNLEKFIYPLCRNLLITFIPNMLNPLQIASHSYGIKKEKDEKRQKKLSHKINKIATRILDNPVPAENNQDLFLNVYQKLDELTQSELKLMKEMYSCLKETKKEKVTFEKYSEIICDTIELKKVKKL